MNNNGLFTVKWEYTDSTESYKHLKSHQFYNHFPDSRKITTKQGLNQTLNQITLPGHDIFSIYPRCFDLSDQRQADLFKDEFSRTAIFSCLKTHAKYFKKQCAEQLKDIRKKDE